MRLIEINEIILTGPEERWKAFVMNSFNDIILDYNYNEDLILAYSDGEVVGVYKKSTGEGAVDVDLMPEGISEARQVWSRRGNKITKKYRCVSGPRKGRVVSHPKQCTAPVNIKKRVQMKKTQASQGKRMNRRAQRTKKTNPSSKRIQRINRK